MVAGSRIGWAIVQNEAIAELMRQHVWIASGYVQESQLRATTLLQYVLNTNGALLASHLPLLSCLRCSWPCIKEGLALETKKSEVDFLLAQRCLNPIHDLALP